MHIVRILLGVAIAMSFPARGALGQVQGIQGLWQAVSVAGAGASSSEGLSIEATDKLVVMRVNNKIVAEAKYTLDPRQTPPTIDLEFQAQSTPGIYELKDNTLRLCFGSEARPTAFADSKDTMLLVLTRSPAWMEQIWRAWQGRQERIRSWRVRWTEDWFMAAKSQGPHANATADEARDMESWLPKQDLTYRRTGSLSCKDGMMRYVQKGPSWHPPLGRLVEREYDVTFDGESSHTLFSGNRPGKNVPHVGFIEEARQATRDRALSPFVMAFRPCDPAVGGINISKYALKSAEVLNDEGVPCVVISSIDEGDYHRTLWLAKGREYVVVRIDVTRKGRPITVTDVSYTCDATHGWVPCAWRFVSQAGSDSIQEKAAATVSDCELNLDLAPSEFQIVFPKGALVRNLKDGEDYMMMDDGQRRAITKEEKQRMSDNAQGPAKERVSPVFSPRRKFPLPPLPNRGR